MKIISAVLGSDTESPWKSGKIQHENESKFGPSYKVNILMQNIREFNHKLIEVSHV